MILSLVLSARAATECLSVDAFNTWMASHAASDTVTLRYDVTGVNPNAFWGTKGALADLTDTSCAAGASLALKVYGPDDPPNTSHPAGTLKQEYGNNCGPMPNEEHWADPNASAEVFVNGSERCDVTIWIDPATFGYRLACDHGTFEGAGDNGPAMSVDKITLFALSDGSTWRIGDAVSTWNEVCFETDETVDDGGDGDGSQVETVRAVADVTVATDFPNSVYSDTTDLCVEAGYSEVYLKFDLSSIPGRITHATLDVRAGSDGSANGSGAEAWAVSDTSWHEDTLVWNARPGAVGSLLDRVGPVTADGAYSLDVSAAVSAPGVYAFALLPAASDTDGAHFRSVESGADVGPELRVTWVPDEGNGEGGGDDDGEGTGTGTDDTDGSGGDPRDTAAGDDARTPGGREKPAELGTCTCGGGAAPGAFGVAWGLVGVLVARRRTR